MKSALGLALVLACAAPTLGAEALELKRGVGVHEWLNWAPLDESDQHYRKPLYQTVDQWRARYRDLSEWPEGDEFARIRGMGFDFIRLTVDPGPLLDKDGADRAEGLAVLEQSVRMATDQGLKVVFDYHLVPQVEAYGQAAMEGPVDAPQLETYRGLLTDTARMLASVGVDKVAFEPMNEPQYYPCDGWAGEDWNKVMGSFVASIRAVSADLTIVATGACGGGPDGLLNLDPSGFDDGAILYSFHSYEPHSFSHQGVGDKTYLAGLPWPNTVRARADVEAATDELMAAQGRNPLERAATTWALGSILEEYYSNEQGPAQLERSFGDIVAWAERNGISSERIFVGEFGVVRMQPDRGGATDEDRFRYIKAVRMLAEQYGMAWSLWEYSNPHGMSLIEPVGPAVPEPLLLRALGL